MTNSFVTVAITLMLALIVSRLFLSKKPFPACLLIDGKRLPQFKMQSLKNAKTYNTSLALFQDHVIFVSRISNYSVCGGVGPSPPPYVSENVFWFRTQEGVGQCKLASTLPPGNTTSYAAGYEDPRIVFMRNEALVVCMLIHRGFSRIFVLRFDISSLLQNLQTSAQTNSLAHLAPTSIEGPLRYKNETDHEKNWVPFLHNDDLHLIPSIQPLIILRLRDGVLQEVRTEPLCDVPASLKSFHLRGGSCAVPWTDTQYIAVGHVVEGNLVSSRSYYSFFYVFETEPFRLVAFSEPFKLEGARIEFVTGLLVVKNEIWVTGGVMDCESVLWHLTRARVEALLRDSRAPAAGSST